MSNNAASTRLIFRLLGASTILMALAGLAVAYGGFADAWLDANAACGNGGNSHSYHACAPGEAQGVIAIVSFAFLVGGVFTTMFVEFLTRASRPTSSPSAGTDGAIRAAAVIDLSRFRSR